jgi:hypothetical protein
MCPDAEAKNEKVLADYYRIVTLNEDVLVGYNLVEKEPFVKYGNVEIKNVSDDEFTLIAGKENLEFMILNNTIIPKDTQGNNIFMHVITGGEMIRYKNQYVRAAKNPPKQEIVEKKQNWLVRMYNCILNKN